MTAPPPVSETDPIDAHQTHMPSPNPIEWTHLETQKLPLGSYTVHISHMTDFWLMGRCRYDMSRCQTFLEKPPFPLLNGCLSRLKMGGHGLKTRSLN